MWERGWLMSLAALAFIDVVRGPVGRDGIGKRTRCATVVCSGTSRHLPDLQRTPERWSLAMGVICRLLPAVPPVSCNVVCSLCDFPPSTWKCRLLSAEKLTTVSSAGGNFPAVAELIVVWSLGSPHDIPPSHPSPLPPS